jgi:hypothetical protein
MGISLPCEVIRTIEHYSFIHHYNMSQYNSLSSLLKNHTRKKHTANQTVQQYEKQNHFAAVPPLGYGVLYELIYCIPCHTENQKLFSHCKLKTAINFLKEEIIYIYLLI